MKNNRIVKYLSTLVLFLLVFGAQAQSWQQHFDEGKRLYNAQDYEGAYLAFQNAHAAAPNPAQIDPFLAQSAYRAGMFKEAADAYSRVNNDKSDTWSHYNEGNAHFKNNDFAKAIESYKQALRKDPTNDVARYNLAQAIKKLKEQQEQQNKNQNKNQNQNSQNSNQNNNPSDPNEQEPDKNQDNPDNQNQESQGQNQPKLSREQTEQLLESMNQADKKAKGKLKEKEKVEGQGKRKKDW